jgi:hypothetical protein
MITLQNLTIEDVQLILSGLSELPTKSGAFPVAMKVKTQAEAQLTAQGEQNGQAVDQGSNQEAGGAAQGA